MILGCEFIIMTLLLEIVLYEINFSLNELDIYFKALQVLTGIAMFIMLAYTPVLITSRQIDRNSLFIIFYTVIFYVFPLALHVIVILVILCLNNAFRYMRVIHNKFFRNW